MLENKLAYNELQKKINSKIKSNSCEDFLITVFDLNDLKKINDIKGHQTGDAYICDACKLICNKFKHSPVFRIGGDEFVAVSFGEDYEHIEELLNSFADHNTKAKKDGGIIIACGMARYNNDASVEPVFSRADKKMYENKKMLKGEAI
ncbi:MAG: GGDEF domain-containing protein [Treponema sp.]|nr:GGDEF domain-containing protein [Treponema sp.]